MMGAESAKNPYSHQADQHERAAFDIKLVEHAQWVDDGMVAAFFARRIR
jgi:hypothetical protein